MYNSFNIIVTLHTPRTLLTGFPVPCQADGIVSLEPQTCAHARHYGAFYLKTLMDALVVLIVRIPSNNWKQLMESSCPIC